MKLFLISQTEIADYDTYDSAVVCAESEDEARGIHPHYANPPDYADNGSLWMGGTWCKSPQAVTVRYLGEATPDVERGVLCASFNAG